MKDNSNTAPLIKSPPLIWKQLSMTVAAYGLLLAFRRKLSDDRSAPVTLGQAVDALILSHPFRAEAATYGARVTH